MEKIKSKIVIVTGAVSIFLALITAYFLFNYTLGQIKKFQDFNDKLIPSVVKINIDIDRAMDAYGSLMHFITFKPAGYKASIKKVSARLRFLINKTGGDYKSLFILIRGQRLNAMYKNSLNSLINKAYFKWNNVSKPMLNIIATPYKYLPHKISGKYPDKYSVKMSFIPTEKLFGLILSSGKKILSIAILVFIAGSMVIIALLVLVIYLINKFVGSIKISERRLKVFFDKLPVPSLIIDVETGLIIEVNEKAVEYYGYSREEFARMNVAAVNPFVGIEESIGFREKALKEGYNFAVLKHILKNGEIRDVEAYVSGVTYNDKPYIQEIINDVTEKLAYQSALSERLTREKETYRELSE
ncbi:MAG: PAS domain S-box protein, partial [bacterium]